MLPYGLPQGHPMAILLLWGVDGPEMGQRVLQWLCGDFKHQIQRGCLQRRVWPGNLVAQVGQTGLEWHSTQVAVPYAGSLPSGPVLGQQALDTIRFQC